MLKRILTKYKNENKKENHFTFLKAEEKRKGIFNLFFLFIFNMLYYAIVFSQLKYLFL